MSRPRPKTRLGIDPDNAYARLGASPLASTDEIKKQLSDKRGKAMAAARARGQQSFGHEEQEIIELQAIEKQIGTQASRDAYDQAHPQNALLTVQPAPRDRAFEPARTAALVTGWLLEELGPEAMLLHPDAYWLWMPGGLDPALAATLATFASEPTGEQVPLGGTTADARPAATVDHSFPGVGDIGALGTRTE